MNYFLIAVKDTAVDAFQPGVHCVRAKGEAMRNFTDLVNDPQSKQLHNHAADFELWIIGELDDQTGIITSKPERLARGTDVKNT
uniref:Nonstructural protein n=1 Tax=Gokushovirinae environmental samples TaxID=1478972 RepID=A0A2R3UAH6_9VIRU|nr:nonstructural protein [Gokushovirinae environmental samples]